MQNILLSSISISELEAIIENCLKKVINGKEPNLPHAQTLYTIEEVAEKIFAAKSQVYQLVHQRRIGFIKISKRLLFTQEHIDEYFKTGGRLKQKSNDPEALIKYTKRKKSKR